MYLKYILLFLIISSSTQATALEANLAAEDNWPPYSTHELMGISQTIIKKAFEISGIKVKFTSYPYARAQKNLLSGTVDGFFSVSKQPSTIAKFHFGKEPLFKAHASFLYNKKMKANFSNLKDIPKGTTLILVRGFEYGKDFEKYKKNFELEYVDNQTQIISMLTNGRPAISIMYDKVLKYYLKKKPTLENIIKKKPSHISHIYVAFNKESPKSKVLSKKLDQGLKKFKNTNIYKSLLDL